MPKELDPELICLLKFAVKIMAEQENTSIDQTVDNAIALIQPNAENKQELIDTLNQIRIDLKQEK